MGMLITDWNMPEMNGLELVKKVRADARFSDLPIIMVTTEKPKLLLPLKPESTTISLNHSLRKYSKEKLAAVLGTEG